MTTTAATDPRRVTATGRSTSSPADLAAYFATPLSELREDPSAPERIGEFLDALESGEIRAAQREPDGTWWANTWVKSGILAAFALSQTLELPGWPGGAVDRSLVPPREVTAADGVRLVPGGTSIRRGSHLAPGVVVMPPSYLNTGAWVGAGSMVDSHVLVGSCAQVGERVHLSAAVQLGGVLEPIGATPVIVEDDAFIGAQCGLFEGVVVRERAVLAPAVTLTSRTLLYDLVNGCEVHGEVPAGAVVVPGSRPARGEYAEGLGLSLYAPVIVKYRDDSTDASTVLEEALR